MGKAGRFACIIVPMALTIASFICLIIVFCGQIKKDVSLSNDLYFFKAVTKDFVDDPDHAIDEANKYFDNELLQALQGKASTKDLKDFYTVGVFNFCEGDIDDKNKETFTYCSKPKANFWFNPMEVWQLSNTSVQQLFPDDMKNVLDTYHKVGRWMYAAFVIVFFLTIAEFLVGLAAICSRWGSLVTTIVSTAQTVFFLAAAITTTALYGSLVGVFESVLRPYKIKTSLGGRMMAVLWLGVAFAVASGFFWLISVCCCSGKSSHKKVVVEKTPYTYERVASPYLGHRGMEGHEMTPPAGHGTTGSAYEPFRQQQV
ncbi:integral membrane protein-like protein [Polyplosphaeria fusca]|uniref:Integral membrane protein-like protein n=1 Tax=Polyplosphaeria fusca TaxID=682080 RepID=A0A9P4R938_9PLEO|nr:integral membrane protein-like protein [Polyplosphaeria fusca]